MRVDTPNRKSGKDASSPVGRRGLVAAAWAAVVGYALKRTERPVQAVAGLQFQDVGGGAPVDNTAGGPTALRASAQYTSNDAVLTVTSTTAPGVGAGVLGMSGPLADGFGVGVQGRSGSGVGVEGESRSYVGVRGVIGTTVASDANAIAVYGMNNSLYEGPSLGAGGFGVYGLSGRGHGLVGATAISGGGAVVGATNSVAGAYAALFYGPVIVSGSFTVFGAKSAAVPHPDGSRRLVYCVESPDSWFEDFGKGTLACGRAEVTIDPDFAAIVDLSDYHVFITSYGITVPLYVMEKTATGFTVEAHDAPALAGSFSWRVVARRKDIEAKRLAPVTMPPQPELPDFPARA